MFIFFTFVIYLMHIFIMILIIFKFWNINGIWRWRGAPTQIYYLHIYMKEEDHIRKMWSYTWGYDITYPYDTTYSSHTTSIWPIISISRYIIYYPLLHISNTSTSIAISILTPLTILLLLSWPSPTTISICRGFFFSATKFSSCRLIWWVISYSS